MEIGYARISTRDQNLDLQEDALKRAGCERIFVETASGAQRDRPKLAEALRFLRPGDNLVIWKLDRLARSVKQLTETVEQLEREGIGLKSLTESIDTSTPSGRLVLHMFGALAEFERQQLRERTIAGIEAAKARGRTGGRPRAISSSDFKAAQAMLKDTDISVSEVAERLGVGVSTLYRAMPGGRTSI